MLFQAKASETIQYFYSYYIWFNSSYFFSSLVYMFAIIAHSKAFITRLSCRYHGNLTIFHKKAVLGETIMRYEKKSLTDCGRHCLGHAHCQYAHHHPEDNACTLERFKDTSIMTDHSVTLLMSPYDTKNVRIWFIFFLLKHTIS